jgi:chromate transporter
MAMNQPETQRPRVTPWDLFVAFTSTMLVSFGGILFWCRRTLVENRRWLTESEFAELAALAQLLPGVNGINLSVLVGYRFAGMAGAAASFLGFIVAPSLMVIALGFLYYRYGALPLARDALAGMSTVAVGLLLSTAGRMATVLQRRWVPWLFLVLAFFGVGVMRWPLLAVLAVLAPCAVVLAWKGKH